MTSRLHQSDEPLYPNILWAKPERADQAGRMLIIGGRQEAIMAPLDAYSAATGAGVGSATVALPDSLKKQLGHLDNILFCPSTPSGSFSVEATKTITNLSASSDTVVLAGDLGNNSETQMLIDSLLPTTSKDPLTILAGDSINAVISRWSSLDNGQTILVLNGSQMQKLAISMSSTRPYKSDIGIQQLEKLLGGLKLAAGIIFWHAGMLWVYIDDELCSVDRADLKDDFKWQAATAAQVATLICHHQGTRFESAVSALYRQSKE